MRPEMSEALRLPDGREPLGLWVERADPPAPDLDCETLEFSSRGDRVRARLLRPAGAAGPLPAVLVSHGLAGAADDPHTEAASAGWARRGAAVLAVDLPLHGARADAKLRAWLSERPGDASDALREALAVEFARQAVMDLSRALDALLARGGVDGPRVAFAGFSLGARIGAAFCALDPRPRAAALALAGAGGVPTEIDPARFVARIAPRPLLFVNASADARVPRARAEALCAAAGEPRQQLWFDGAHDALPGEALKAMWTFLARSTES